MEISNLEFIKKFIQEISSLYKNEHIIMYILYFMGSLYIRSLFSLGLLILITIYDRLYFHKNQQAAKRVKYKLSQSKICTVDCSCSFLINIKAV